MIHCRRCKKTDIDVADDGNLTCLACGCIVEETDNLRNELDLVTNEGGTRACGRYVTIIL
jgi:transcription initiation factor TFIIIB Brf1 subunit/transcription initiation factor TFIIB